VRRSFFSFAVYVHNKCVSDLRADPKQAGEDQVYQSAVVVIVALVLPRVVVPIPESIQQLLHYSIGQPKLGSQEIQLIQILR
jgi:hypothetical protein